MRATYDEPVSLPTNPPTYLPVGPVRQRGAVAVGGVGAVLGAVVLAVLVSSGELRGAWSAGMLWWIGLNIALFVRPSLTLTEEGVRVANPLRVVEIPWAQVRDVASQWNLEVHTVGAGRVVAWAISSQRLNPHPKRVTRDARTVAELLVEVRDEMGAGAENAVVRRQWDLVGLALLGVPTVLVLAALVSR